MIELLNAYPNWIILILLILIFALVIYLVNKNVSIKLGSLTIEQQKKIVQQSQDDNIRLKIHAQIREYENYTGKIERIIFHGFEDTFPDMTPDEKTIAKLFCNVTRRALEKQLMLDIIANHITEKTPEQLREYTSDKVMGYQNRICNFMASYNNVVLPNNDIIKVVNRIDMNELNNIYYNIYSKAIQIAKQK